MFEIAFAIGIFSYSIFLLGLLSLLYKPVIILFSCVFWTILIIWKGKSILSFFKNFSIRNFSPLFLLGIGYLFVQACVNAIGLLGPEISFDALWYHLTLPKLYLMYHAVIHFPGSVLYYSDMPRLTEMLYTAGLAFGSDFFARSIHFTFGILTCFAIYKIGRKYFSPQWSLLLPVIFYSNLVVGWESSAGYIDLSRTFFTIVALLAFLTWIEKKDKKYFTYSAIFLGLTIATKLLTLPDLGIYAIALLFYEHRTISLKMRVKSIALFFAIALSSALPWFAFAYIHTGNPFYPMFTNYGVGNYWQMLSPLYFVQSVWETFSRASDPINPLFLALFPFLILFWKKLWKEIPLLIIFAVGGFISWYITPQTGGGRYILPYLPIFSLVFVYMIRLMSKRWQKISIVFIGIVALISLGYRGIAVAKIFPVIAGHETKQQYIGTHLQYNLGDFYDIDGYFAHHIKPTDTVLLFGFHNLYYVDFPFILSDWVQKGDTFDYIAVQGLGMPERFTYWNLVYYNATTQVRLYSLNGQTWYY